MLDSRVVFVRHILSFFELLFLLGALFCLDIGRRKKSRGAGFSRRLKKKNLPSQSKDEKSFVDKHVYLPIPSFFSLFTNTHRMFETFSFLPPLSDADLSKQVQYLLNNGWTPCLEFEDPAHAYTDGHGNSVWTPPSTPTTTTTDTGSCGSCRCTVATTRLKSSLK